MANFFRYLGNRPFALLAVLCMLITFFATNHYRWRGENWKHTVSSDGEGYYAYLPALFIYDDWKFEFYRDINTKYYGREGGAPFLNLAKDVIVDKYYCGEAVLHAPFYGMATLVAKVGGWEVDGYSRPFQYAVSISCWIYIFIGLYFLYRFLREWFAPRLSALTVFLLYLGSNLFYYSVFEPAAVHSYAFAAVACFIWLARRSMVAPSDRLFYALALNAGLLFLLRPTDLIVALALPALAGNMTTLQNWWKALFQLRVLAVCVILFGLLFSIQAAAYHAQVDRWWIYAYGNEGFDFTNPHVLQVLFGFRVGLFVYSPILWLAIPGVLLYLRKWSFSAVSWVAFIFINTYIISSWWAWHYEGTFGMRPYIDFLGWFALPMALCLSSLRGMLKPIVIGLCVSIVGIVHFQGWQRYKVIIPWSNFDFYKYNFVFLHHEEEFVHLFSHKGVPALVPGVKELEVKHLHHGEWGKFQGHSEELRFDSTKTVIYTQVFDSTFHSQDFIQLDLQGEVKMEKPHMECSLVFETFHDGKTKDWILKHFLEASATPGEYNWFFQIADLAKKCEPGDSLHIWVKNESGAPVYLKNLRMVQARAVEE
jgi:hypothetical protein